MVLRQSLAIFKARFGSWLVISVSLTLLLLPLNLLPLGPLPKIGVGVVTGVMATMVQAIITCGAYQSCCALDFRLADIVDLTLRRSLPILGIALLIFLGMFVFSLIAGFSAVAGFVRSTGVGYAVLAVIFPAALAVLYVSGRIFVAIPACIIEQLGPLASLKRSIRLTKPHPWKALLLSLISLAPSLLALGAGALLGYLAPKFVHGLSSSASSRLVLSLALAPVSWVVNILTGILVATTYAELRRTTEGLTSKGIVDVFD
ncbi:MAG: hypothetical protein FWD68_10230 [Alphaproteobacteria bacterium]|nr:hypothetical protein [Alphaproteobacteria bacterium]